MKKYVFIIIILFYPFFLKGQSNYFVISVYENCKKVTPEKIILTDSFGLIINFQKKEDTIFLKDVGYNEFTKGTIKVIIGRNKFIEWREFILCDNLLTMGYIDKKSMSAFNRMDWREKIESSCDNVLYRKDWKKIKRAYYISSCGRVWERQFSYK